MGLKLSELANQKHGFDFHGLDSNYLLLNNFYTLQVLCQTMHRDRDEMGPRPQDACKSA